MLNLLLDTPEIGRAGLAPSLAEAGDSRVRVVATEGDKIGRPLLQDEGKMAKSLGWGAGSSQVQGGVTVPLFSLCCFVARIATSRGPL